VWERNTNAQPTTPTRRRTHRDEEKGSEMENFWSIIWVVIWSFVFVAYLFVLFYILTDLFRDHQLSGWWKALWIIFLIFMPYLTALVYIIARGRGMSERQLAAAREARSETDAYIKHIAGSGGGKSPAQHIADAKALLDSGTITQAEFDQLKAKALA
jgi:small-conductance mechanosensitive channel